MTEINLSGAQFVLAIAVLVLIGVAIGRATAPLFKSQATGPNLDWIASNYGVQRKRWLFGLLKESDRKLRQRIECVVKNNRMEW